jgi:hypothetical protein
MFDFEIPIFPVSRHQVSSKLVLIFRQEIRKGKKGKFSELEHPEMVEKRKSIWVDVTGAGSSSRVLHVTSCVDSRSI